MRLRTRLILSFLITGVLPLLILGIIGLLFINKTIFDDFNNFYQAQLFHINNNINTLISDVEFDIENLSQNKYVITKNDKNFTNFLNAEENTFKYNIGTDEQKIIDFFYSYLTTHPYINSVYMGRENGSFVRSHPRPKPTKYDPRERPWYKLAKENPDRVTITEPYISVTSDDVNIGVVKALVDENNRFYGVVGADITLDRLTEFVSHIKLLNGRYIAIFDKNKKILSYPDKNMLFLTINELKIKNLEKIFNKKQGYIKFNDKGNNYLFFYTSENTGWKICSIIPAQIITKHFVNIATVIFSGILFIAIVFIVISFMVANNFYSPFKTLLNGINNLVDKVKSKMPYENININTKDEIQELSDSFNIMGEELTRAYNKLNGNYRRIKEVDKLKSAFISMVSHELRTPLTIIKGSAALLSNDKVLTADKNKQDLLRMTQDNINRLQTLIDDLLDLSKIETGVFPVVKTKNNIIEVLNNTIEEIVPVAKVKHINIIKKYNDGILEWNFDKIRMERVITSVLNNAIKFSYENSEIEIDAKIIKGKDLDVPYYVESIIFFKKNYLLISIADKGIGIEKEYLEKVFDKLFQIEDPLTRKYSGAGIGLSISRSIVEQHNGYMWAESEGINKGSKFYILLSE